jgi:hypothetical protein
MAQPNGELEASAPSPSLSPPSATLDSDSADLPVDNSLFFEAFSPALPAPSSPPPRASRSFSPPLSPTFLSVYFGIGSTLLLSGAVIGFRMGTRQAARLERDYPVDTSRSRPPPPPISPQQRRWAVRMAFGSLGIGTALCALLGWGLTAFISRRLEVNNTREFAVRMETMVPDALQRSIGGVVSEP